MVQSVFGSVVQRDASPSHRGRILSWYQGAIGLAYGVGLLVMGTLVGPLRAAHDVRRLRRRRRHAWWSLARRSATWTNAIDGVEAPVPEPVVAAAFGG